MKCNLKICANHWIEIESEKTGTHTFPIRPQC